jgi:rhamnogalacturonyl hydrolase YesR
MKLEVVAGRNSEKEKWHNQSERRRRDDKKGRGEKWARGFSWRGAGIWKQFRTVYATEPSGSVDPLRVRDLWKTARDFHGNLICLQPL